MALPQPEPTDERRHPPGDDLLWGESWYFDFAAADGSIGGYVRLGLYPNQGKAWYWACLVGPDRPLVIVVDHDIPVPSGEALEIRATGLWADHNVEEPLERWSLGLESFALSIDDPTEMYRDARGDRVPFGFDLEWETDGEIFRYDVTDRYEVPCRVHGQILVGDETIELDGVGQRDHSWGVRDWWQLAWVWSAFHLADGAHLFGNCVEVSPDFTFRTGYLQGEPAGSDARVAEYFGAAYEPSSDGLVRDVRWELDGLEAAVETVAWAPVLLVAPDGRRSHFARAMCRATLADGRTGMGWMEFNQPEK
jgi:hypothetical protein